MAHKKSGELKIKCYQRDLDFESEKEVKSHIRNNHKTYKACKNFVANQCQYAEDECSFNHIILQLDQHLCFKCNIQIFLKNRYDESCQRKTWKHYMS